MTKLLFTLLAISSSFVAFAYGRDDGRRCTVCGRYTMKGGSHICKDTQPQKPKQKVVPEPRLNTKLPLLEDRKVHYIKIRHDMYGQAHAYLKLIEKNGKSIFWELTEPMYSRGNEEHEKAVAYYKEHLDMIPVMPVSENDAQGSFVYSQMIKLAQSYERAKEEAIAQKKLAEQNRVRERQLQQTIYKALGSLGGRKIFATPLPEDKPNEQFKDEVFDFSPNSSCFGSMKCLFAVTPKQKRIYEIKLYFPSTSEDIQSDKRAAIEKQFKAQMIETDGALQLMGVNSKGNQRILSLTVEEDETVITLLDIEGQKLATNEGSKYQESCRQKNAEKEARKRAAEEQRRKEEEKHRLETISNTQTSYTRSSDSYDRYLAERDAQKAQKEKELERLAKGTWKVYIESLRSKHTRIMEGKPAPDLPKDDLIIDGELINRE